MDHDIFSCGILIWPHNPFQTSTTLGGGIALGGEQSREFCTHFSDGTKAELGQISGPRSHSKLIAEMALELESIKSSSQSLSHTGCHLFIINLFI